MQLYSTPAGRINLIKGETLAHAIPYEVLGLGCKMRPFPKGRGDTIIYRRWLPFGATAVDHNTMNRPVVSAAAHLLTEGVTPNPDTISPVDVQATMLQYGCVYAYSDKSAYLNEDDIPEEMKEQVGQRMGLVREMVRFGAMRAASNMFFAGGTSRAMVDRAISLPLLRRVARSLKRNFANKKTRILSPGPNFGTSAIEAGWLVFVSSDCESDVRDLPGFTPVADYANRSPISEHEIGSVEEFRFILSASLVQYPNAGAAVGATGMFSTGGANVDVYPYIVVGEEAVFDIALRGADSFNITHIPHGRIEKSDPLGQRGVVGASFWSAVMVANQGHMAVIEAGATNI